MATNRIYLAGGCFWGVQKFFDQFRGVTATETGYANGNTSETTYDDIRGTDHAEAVMVEYDDEVISLAELLNYYFMIIDPVSVNKQGMDIGRQYRTGIYYTDESVLPVIEGKLASVQAELGKSAVVAVEVGPLENFCRAEDFHQKYLDKVPWGYCHINRDMFALQERLDRGAGGAAKER